MGESYAVQQMSIEMTELKQSKNLLKISIQSQTAENKPNSQNTGSSSILSKLINMGLDSNMTVDIIQKKTNLQTPPSHSGDKEKTETIPITDNYQLPPIYDLIENVDY